MASTFKSPYGECRLKLFLESVEGILLLRVLSRVDLKFALKATRLSSSISSSVSIVDNEEGNEDC